MRGEGGAAYYEGEQQMRGEGEQQMRGEGEQQMRGRGSSR